MIRFGENSELVYISAANSDDSLPRNFYTSRENQILKDTMQFPGKSKFPEIIRFRFCGTALSATRSYTMIGFPGTIRFPETIRFVQTTKFFKSDYQIPIDNQIPRDFLRASQIPETIKFP